MQFVADADIYDQKGKIKILIAYNVNQDLYNRLLA